MNWEPYEMTNYAKKYDFNWCKSNLIPVAKLNNGGTGSTFSLKVGISYTSVLGAYGALPITCWGSVFETTTVSQNNNYTSPPTHTISGLPVEYTAYIYGAALSHLMIDNLESVFNDVTNATNLRYFSSSGGTATFTRMDLSKNNKLVFVSMNRNQSLAGISINSPDLLLLNVNENHKLNSLVFNNSIKLETLAMAGCTSLKYNNISSLTDKTKLTKVYVYNMGWDACMLDQLYKNLPATHPSGALIGVGGGDNIATKNDFAGSNKTIATDKSWKVMDGVTELKGNGYGCGYDTPIAGSPVITLKASGASIRIDLRGEVINADDEVTPVWIENNTGQFIKKLITKDNWTGYINVPVNNSTIKIHGRVRSFDISDNSGISEMTVSANHPTINSIYTYGTGLDACAMDALYNSLPSRTTTASIYVRAGSVITPGFLTSTSSIAKGKGWKTLDGSTELAGDGTGCVTNYTVTYNANPTGGTVKVFNGTTLVNSGASVPQGTVLTVTTTPNTGYKLSTLTANGADIMTSKKFTVQANTTVAANFALEKYAVTFTQPANGSIKLSYEIERVGQRPIVVNVESGDLVVVNTIISITATPNEGYKLATLTADGKNIMPSKKFTVQANTTVAANFALEKYAVTFTQPANGSIKLSYEIERVGQRPIVVNVESGDLVVVNTIISITATPNEGYKLATLTADGKNIMPIKKFVVQGNTAVVASFTKQQYAVTFTQPANGTLKVMRGTTAISSGTLVDYDTELSVEATPNTGYQLNTLTAGGVDIMTTKKFAVKAATALAASFAKQTFAVTLQQGTGGTISIEGYTAEQLKAVPYGTKLTVKVVPATNYGLKTLTANGVDIMQEKSFTVSAATTVAATFTKETFAITLVQSTGGTITIDGYTTEQLKAVPAGTTLTVKVTPAATYGLKSLTVNGADITSSKSFTVTGPATVTAVFTKETFAVTLQQGNGGTISIAGYTAEQLKAVASGTELAVNILPDMNYSITTLTANGKDILDTKRFVVTGNTTVAATFAIDTYEVTLLQAEGGTISIKGKTADELLAIPHGTNLVVDVIEDENYRLKSLTANGVDIMGAKSFSVVRNTEIKVEFLNTTGLSEVEAARMLSFYPNPARERITVKISDELMKAEVLTITDISGRTMQIEPINDNTMILDVSKYAKGVYLIKAGKVTRRLVVK